MYLDDFGENFIYVIMEVNWAYNDSWCDRKGATLTNNVFQDYWAAEYFCREKNAKYFLENIEDRWYSPNLDLNWKQALSSEFKSNFSYENYKLKLIDEKINMDSLGNFLMEHSLSKYEIVQIPKDFKIT